MANPNPVTAHLKATQFQPGHKAHGGRPRKRPQSEANEDWLRALIAAKERLRFANAGYHLPKHATNADGVALALGLKALRGDVNAGKELRESVEGKSKIRVEVEDHTKHTPRLVVVFEGQQPVKEFTAELPAIDVKSQAVAEAIAQAESEENSIETTESQR